MTIHYLDVDGAPAVFDDTYADLPRKLIDGRWVRMYTRAIFDDGVPITKERFDEMVAKLGGSADPWEDSEGGQS